MSDNVQGLKEDMTEVKGTLKDMVSQLTELRVLIAGNYTHKDDFAKCQKLQEDRVVSLHQKREAAQKELDVKIEAAQKELDVKIEAARKESNAELSEHIKTEKENRWKFYGILIAIMTLTTTLIQIIFKVAAKLGDVL